MMVVIFTDDSSTNHKICTKNLNQAFMKLKLD